MSEDLEGALRETFAARAETVAGGPAPYADTVRRARAARRRRRGAAAVAVAAVLAGGVPAGLDLGDRTPPVSSQYADALRWPVRGSLAGDAGFLNGLRDDTLRRGAPGAVHVLFAGDDGRHRVAVLVAVRGAEWRQVVRYGASGTAPRALGQEELSSGRGPVGTAPILWFGDGAGPLLVVGPPDMTDIRLSPAISYRPDGTAFRTSRTVRADHGAVLTEVAGVRPGQLSVRFHLSGGYTGPRSAPVTVTGGDPAAYRAAVAAAAGRAAGHVDAERARGLLDAAAGYLGTTGDRLTYRFWWGGPLGGSRDAVIATLHGPAGPRLRVVQVTHTDKDGGTEQDRYAVVIRGDADANRPIGWTTAAGQDVPGGTEHATGAVYVPGGPGTRVELWDGGTRLMARTTDPSGLAVFVTRLPQVRLRVCEYHVLDAKGAVTAHGGLGLPGLETAAGWNVRW